MATKDQVEDVLQFPGFLVKNDYSQRDEEEFLEYIFIHLAEFEGSCPYLYLDTNGYVTIGIGHHVINALSNTYLPYTYKSPPSETTVPVSNKEKEDEWIKVKNLITKIKINFLGQNKTFPSHKNSIFKEATKLQLDVQDIKKLFDNDVSVRLKEIERIFPRFKKYPDPAKLGIVDLYFNVRDFWKFVNFRKYVTKEQWHLAGSESGRKGPNQDRLDKAKRLFDEAEEIKTRTDSRLYKINIENTDDFLVAEKSYDDIWQS
jgi:hypothetical protein